METSDSAPLDKSTESDPGSQAEANYVLQFSSLVTVVISDSEAEQLLVLPHTELFSKEVTYNGHSAQNLSASCLTMTSTRSAYPGKLPFLYRGS